MMILSEIRDQKHSTQTVSQVSFDSTYDVVVCGLGTAGALAAAFSAEKGLSVLGVEQFTCPGGTYTAGGVPHPYFGCPGGQYEALEERITAFADRCAIRAEAAKLILEGELTGQKVTLSYESAVIGVYLQARTVVGLRIITPNGVRNIAARMVLDCTAEAVVADMAGCATEYGRESDGQTQPYSMVSLVYDKGRYRLTNVDCGRVDQRSDEALSRAILFGRAHQMQEERQGKLFIAHRPLIGLREGRRIVAEEGVCIEDLFADKKTDQPAYFAYADLDKHGWDIAFDSAALGDWAIGANLGAYNVTVAVPYKSILPKDFDGILVPCRALGVDRDISSCVRMLPDMRKLAEVAAQWVSLALEQNKKLREVPYARLRERLQQSGCLKESDDRGYRIDGKRNWDGTPLVPEQVRWVTDPEELEALLKTGKPGQGIWSAKRMGSKAVPVLRKLLSAGEENTVKHAAFALASLGNREGVQILRQMVKTRDGRMLEDCRKNNQLRGCMAIYWLGRLADEEITPWLTELICDENEQAHPVYQTGVRTTRYQVHDFDDVYFQFMSQSVMALIRIGDAHAHLRPQIEKAFRAAFSTDAYYRRITKKPEHSSEGNMVLTMKQIAFSAARRWYMDMKCLDEAPAQKALLAGDHDKAVSMEEICAGKTILVKSNDRVVGIQIMRGYMGVGGSNPSGFSADGVSAYTARELNGREPICVAGSEICALVNDVMYFRCKDHGNMRIHTLDWTEGERLYRGDSVGYDTVSAEKVVLLLR